MLDEINVLYYNARSICAKAKADELFNFIKSNSIDVALISETWLKPENSFSFKEFKIYRFDRPGIRKGGGVAIAVRNNINHSLIPHFNLQVIETIGISIPTSSGDIELISAYYPGTSYSTEIFNSFTSDIKYLTNRKSSFFVCGDLNSRHRHWNCLRSNRTGNIIYNEMDFSNFIVENPPSPTYFSHQANPSTLDIILTNNRHQSSQATAHQALSSDHLPVSFKIFVSSVPTLTDVPQLFRYDKVNWKFFKEKLSNEIYI